MRPLVVAIHGILTGQTVATWPDRLDGYIEALPNFDAKVLKKKYKAAPFPAWNRFVRNPGLARGVVAEILELQQPRKIYFIAHSNGTDIALRAIKLLAKKGLRTECFIAIGSVLNPDVGTNGVLGLIERGLLGSAVAYCSRNDGAIGFTSKMPTAYSRLGVSGWEYDGEPFVSARVRSWFQDEHGHGTWFEPAHIEQTFKTALHDFGINDRTRNVSDEITA